jgi:hypothetical protein
MCLRRNILQVYCEGIFGDVTSYATEKTVFMAKVSCKCESIALLQINYRQRLIFVIVCKDLVAKAL